MRKWSIFLRANKARKNQFSVFSEFVAVWSPERGAASSTASSNGENEGRGSPAGKVPSSTETDDAGESSDEEVSSREPSAGKELSAGKEPERLFCEAQLSVGQYAGGDTGVSGQYGGAVQNLCF